MLPWFLTAAVVRADLTNPDNINDKGLENVGGWGGTCTCPDGQVYQVGDMYDQCGTLWCLGGTAGQCNSYEGPWSRNSVVCKGTPFEVAMSLLKTKMDEYQAGAIEYYKSVDEELTLAQEAAKCKHAGNFDQAKFMDVPVKLWEMKKAEVIALRAKAYEGMMKLHGLEMEVIRCKVREGLPLEPVWRNTEMKFYEVVSAAREESLDVHKRVFLDMAKLDLETAKVKVMIRDCRQGQADKVSMTAAYPFELASEKIKVLDDEIKMLQAAHTQTERWLNINEIAYKTCEMKDKTRDDFKIEIFVENWPADQVNAGESHDFVRKQLREQTGFGDEKLTDFDTLWWDYNEVNEIILDTEVGSATSMGFVVATKNEEQRDMSEFERDEFKNAMLARLRSALPEDAPDLKITSIKVTEYPTPSGWKDLLEDPRVQI